MKQLPEKWFIRGSLQLKNYFESVGANDLEGLCSNCGYYIINNKWNYFNDIDSNERNGYEEITLEDYLYVIQNKIKEVVKDVKDLAPSHNIKDNVASLTKLGSKETRYIYDTPTPELLEVFENQFPKRQYVTEFIFNEFSSLCPKTGQPDFATITIKYIANKYCIETKSLKLYLLSYRMYGTFMETLTNRILEDLVAVCSPEWMKITSNFNARGGTLINVTAIYDKNNSK